MASSPSQGSGPSASPHSARKEPDQAALAFQSPKPSPFSPTESGVQLVPPRRRLKTTTLAQSVKSAQCFRSSSPAPASDRISYARSSSKGPNIFPSRNWLATWQRRKARCSLPPRLPHLPHRMAISGAYSLSRSPTFATFAVFLRSNSTRLPTALGYNDHI